MTKWEFIGLGLVIIALMVTLLMVYRYFIWPAEIAEGIAPRVTDEHTMPEWWEAPRRER